MKTMKLASFAITCVLGFILAAPLAGAHISSAVNPNGYGASVSCSSSTTLYPVSGGCVKHWFVPSGASHAHSTSIFPYGGLTTMEIRIQEPIPVLGDYVTWYDRVCTNGIVPQTDLTPAQCAGGQVRDWHTGLTHKWSAEAQQAECIPLYCKWTMATVFY